MHDKISIKCRITSTENHCFIFLEEIYATDFEENILHGLTKFILVYTEKLVLFQEHLIYRQTERHVFF